MGEEISKITRLRRLEKRDWHLWWMAILMILALTTAIIGIQAPELIGAPKTINVQLRIYLISLPILVILFCVYVLQTIYSLAKLKRQLSSTEQEKMHIQSLLETVKDRTEKLQASEANYRPLLEKNVDALVVVDRNGIVRFLNPAAVSLFGCRAEELLGRPFRFPVPGERRMEIQIERPDESAAIAEMRVIEITWEGGKAWLASLRDITLRKKAEETLKAANEELRRLDQIKSNFISMVSHELRTPLTSIKNAVDLLISPKTGEINEDQERFLHLAERNIDRLVAILNDLLDLSKIEAGKMQFHFSEVDLRSLLNHTAAAFQPQAESGSLTLRVECPETLPAVYADPFRIEQVLCNLLSNAIKFTPAGGQVTLTARCLQDVVEVSVTDTGIGIAPENQKKIFERFYQVDDSLTRTSHGTGLGLTITRQLIEAHGGSISLESQVGQGSRFFFALPVFSPRILEMVEFEAEFQRYRDNPCISLLLLKLNEVDLPAPIEWFYQLEEAIRKLLPRASDKIISQVASRRLLILLTGTPKWGGLVVARKLEQALSENPIVIKGVPASVQAIFGPVCYPEDGKTARELIGSALRLIPVERRQNE